MGPWRRLAWVGVVSLCAAGLVACTADAEDDADEGGDPVNVLPLVPAPQRAVALDGAPFTVSEATAVVAPPGAEDPATRVAEALRTASGFEVPVVQAASGGTAASGLVVLTLAVDVPDGPEAYRLTVDEAGVRLTARTVEGLHRGTATLGQLLVGRSGAVSVPAVEVEDAPRYEWRGLSVDVARHFFPVEDLEVLVDLIAGYKLNVLHLHLTDDQGWRIEMPSRPELVARSSGTAVDGASGGYYTADDWARLVAYGAERGIVVVPEIDVPGHVNAALHAVPGLNESGEAVPEYTGIEVGFSGLRASLPETGPFLADVFGDLAAMTAGEYVHIGGDEADEVAPDEYARLVATAAAEVRASGKQVVGWQEIANAPLEPGTVVQYWREFNDPAPVVAAADAGARVLMSPASRTYLDMKYEAGYPLGQDWAALIELRDAYDWDPGAYLPGLDAASVIGVEAAIWTETLSTRDELTQMLLPRLAAVAEVAWSSSARDFDDFAARIAPHGAAWDRAGLAWYASPQVDWP